MLLSPGGGPLAPSCTTIGELDNGGGTVLVETYPVGYWMSGSGRASLNGIYEKSVAGHSEIANNTVAAPDAHAGLNEKTTDAMAAATSISYLNRESRAVLTWVPQGWLLSDSAVECFLQFSTTPLMVHASHWSKVDGCDDSPPTEVVALLDEGALQDLKAAKLAHEEMLRRANALLTHQPATPPPGSTPWRVVHTRVVVREQPSTSARAIGFRSGGERVHGGEMLGDWLHVHPAPGQHDVAGWMLVNGASVGLGVLLECHHAALCLSLTDDRECDWESVAKLAGGKGDWSRGSDADDGAGGADGGNSDDGGGSSDDDDGGSDDGGSNEEAGGRGRDERVERIRELQAELFAEDVDVDSTLLEQMLRHRWTEEEIEDFFSSGGCTRPRSRKSSRRRQPRGGGGSSEADTDGARSGHDAAAGCAGDGRSDACGSVDERPLERGRLWKEEGNRAFSRARWQVAEHSYTRALEVLVRGEAAVDSGGAGEVPWLRATVMCNRSAARRLRRNLEGSLRDASEVLLQYPAYYKAAFRRAVALFELERYPEARHAFEQCLRLDNHNGSLMPWIARLHERLRAPPGRLLYSLLDVPSDCTEAVLKRGYKMQSLRCHPDRVRAPSGGCAGTAGFQELQRAYECLRDPTSRELYDYGGAEYQQLVRASYFPDPVFRPFRTPPQQSGMYDPCD